MNNNNKRMSMINSALLRQHRELPEKEETINNGVHNDVENGVCNVENNSNELIRKNPNRPSKKTTDRKELLFDVKQLELEAQRNHYESMYGGRDPLELSDLSGQQIELIPVVCEANVKQIWDFCVGYCAIAMGRKGTADDFIMIGPNRNDPVGLYWFAALTLFYSFEEAIVGRIPPIQRMEEKLREMFWAVAPVNKQGKAYTGFFTDNVLDLMQHNLPYHSFENPLITLAPHVGFQTNGDPVLASNPPGIMFSLDDIREVGPEAFEKVQRYFLADDGDRVLVSYTMDGPLNNTSMFAVPRNTEDVNPVKGFGQFVNETTLSQRDVWLISLGFYTNTKLRDGWNAKTVQLGTHHALYYLLKNDSMNRLPKKTQTHMINLATLLVNDLGTAIAAEFSAKDDQNMDDVVFMASGTGPVDFGYLSNVTAQDYLRYSLSVHSRRFWLGSALCTGTPMPDEDSTVIGAGSRYLTTNNVDNQVGFLSISEELAALSAFMNPQGILSIPALTIRGTVSSLNLTDEPENPNMKWLLDIFLPQLSVYPYQYQLAGGGTVDHTTDVSYTSGDTTDDSMAHVSSIISMLQPYASVSAASGSRDGQRRMHLDYTHYLTKEEVQKDNVDRTPLFTLESVLSAGPFDPKHMANVFNEIFPVMYGDDSIKPAYQVLLWRKYDVEINRVYLDYRAPIIFARGHKRASNILGPSEWGAMNAHSTLACEGGNFMDVFMKGGRLFNSAKLIGEGILDIVAPNLSKALFKKGVRLTSEDAVHKAVRDGELHSSHLAPVAMGFVGLNEYNKAIDEVHNPAFRNSHARAPSKTRSYRKSKKSKQ
jgi:hypothetical protein